MGMAGAITAVGATTMVGIAVTIMAGGIITIGSDFHLTKKGCTDRRPFLLGDRARRGAVQLY
jgi:hypothetical protein